MNQQLVPFSKFIGLLLCALIGFSSLSFAKSIRCQKEAEAVAISESKKKANLPAELMSTTLPTEMDGQDVVVYIGAHANYNYFKLKMDQKCQLVKIVDVEYADASGVAAVASSPKIENRCGWFDNPTPGNAWLHDKDGEWTIATQGEYEAQGHWNPAFDLDNEQTFVRTGSSYGHGCVCMKVESDLAAKKIRRVSSIKIKNLSVCRKDKSLKEPNNFFKRD